MHALDGIVIVGAGLAGLRSAQALREAGYDGRITLIGAERHLPYDRPPLSKAVLLKQQSVADCALAPENFYRDQHIDVRLDTEVVAIHRELQNVQLASGERLPYGRLLLCTGAAPRQLRVPGAELQGVTVLRTADDAERLAQLLVPGQRIVLIGGGFIGLEAAASAVAAGCEVTVLEAAERLLMRNVPAAIAAVVEARHRAAGVHFVFNARIEALLGNGRVSGVRLAGGETLPCGVVIAGIGAEPRTALAQAAGLPVDDGIVVDERLATSDPAIYAAGDVCRFPLPPAGRSVRLECWKNAEDQAVTVARNLLGQAVPHAAVPWFWSDQYELTLQIAGLPLAGQRVIQRHDPQGALLLFYLADDGTLLAASGVGPASVGRDVRIAQKLIERRSRVSPEHLADPQRKLKSLLVAEPA